MPIEGLDDVEVQELINENEIEQDKEQSPKPKLKKKRKNKRNRKLNGEQEIKKLKKMFEDQDINQYFKKIIN